MEGDQGLPNLLGAASIQHSHPELFLSRSCSRTRPELSGRWPSLWMTRRGWCGRRRWQHGGNGECLWLALLGRRCLRDAADGTISVPTGSCWGARAGERPASPPCADRQSDRPPLTHPPAATAPQRAGAGARGPTDSTPRCGLCPAPARGRELCCRWLAQPLLQPRTVRDRLAWLESAGLCARVRCVAPPRQRNKSICFGNAAAGSMQPGPLQCSSLCGAAQGAAGYQPLTPLSTLGNRGGTFSSSASRSMHPPPGKRARLLKKKIISLLDGPKKAPWGALGGRGAILCPIPVPGRAAALPPLPGAACSHRGAKRGRPRTARRSCQRLPWHPGSRGGGGVPCALPRPRGGSAAPGPQMARSGARCRDTQGGRSQVRPVPWGR